MHIGIDLAWNTRRRTGLAAVDDDGALVASGAALRDEEIDAWLAELGGGVVNVAIDAPLVVTNASGMRQCERLVGSAYGRFDASCHASNRGISYFDPPRAWTLAQRHGWVTDPDEVATVARPAAIEVYPHAAMVGLFRLGRILKYKSGPLLARREAFLELLERMESIDALRLSGGARWQEIRELVQAAARPFELDRVEDEVDAVLCAHLAWLWHRDRGALHVFGDARSGYIVAPPPPAHPASPRSGVVVPPPAAMMNDDDSVPAPALIDVVGRPTGYGGSSNEQAWKEAVRSAVMLHRYPAPTRLAFEVEFRLGPDQCGHNAPNLDNLLTSTINAFDGLLGRRPVGRPHADDERIDRITASKRLVQPAEVPGATIVIWPLP